MTPALQPAPWHSLPVARHSVPAELAGWLLQSQTLLRTQGGGGIPSTAAHTASRSHLTTSPALTPQPATGQGTSPTPIAPDRFPAPFPSLPTSTRHGCRRELSADTGTIRVILSSVAQNTQEGCAQWQTEVTQAQSKEKHFRPQNGTRTTWVFKATRSAAGTSPGLC